MRKILVLLLLTVTYMTSAQNSVKDYFFENGTEEIYFNNKGNLYYIYEFAENTLYRGLGAISNPPEAVEKETVKLTKNSITVVERVAMNQFVGKKYSEPNQIILKLPKPGQILRWSYSYEYEKADYSAELKVIQIGNDDYDVIKVTIYPYWKGKRNNKPNIQYWAKGIGLLIETIIGGSSFTHRCVHTSWKEVKWYDVEKKRLEEERNRMEAEEKARLERLKEIERKKQERREKIDAFMANVDENAVYDIASDSSTYISYKNELFNRLKEVVERYNPDNIDIEVTDDITINRHNITSHDIKISAEGNIEGNIYDEIKNELEKLNFKTLRKPIPDTDTTYSVTVKDRFILKHNITTTDTEFVVTKKKKGIKLIKGDEGIYTMNSLEINKTLDKNGKYELDVKQRNIDNSSKVTIGIKDFNKPVNSIAFGYTFSVAAPLGLAVATNGIYSKHWGAYISFRTSVVKTKSNAYKPEAFVRIKKNGYDCFNFNVGATYSISKYGYLYAGIGYGKNGIIYSASGDDSNQDKETYRFVNNKTSGINIDLGAVIKPIKWLGISIGYNFVPAKQFYSDMNFGIMFFI